MRTLKFAFKRAARGRGLVDHDFRQPGEVGLKFSPKPGCHNLDGRTFESLDIIEVAVIHHSEQGGHRLGYAFMVVNPANFFIDLALDMDLHFEAVSVHLTAFVVLREARQRVGGFEAKIFDESGAHDQWFLAQG